MKKIAFLSLALFALSAAVFADDQVRNAQTELKNLGFYYGDVTGQSNAETTAAIRRYQIRNGLEVTGTLNQETLAALSLGPKPAPTAKAPKPAPPPVAEKKEPPVHLRRDNSTAESDREFLKREEKRSATTPPNSSEFFGNSRRNAPDAVAPLAPPDPEPPERDSSVIDPPEPLEAPSADYPVLFAGTPFANAPLPVQQQTLRRAQSLLANRGFYRDVVDGLPGPATEEAILTYQRSNRLTLTGRLDLDTLAELRLLPGTTDYSDAGRYRPPQRSYRGIWINKGRLQFGIEFD